MWHYSRFDHILSAQFIKKQQQIIQKNFWGNNFFSKEVFCLKTLGLSFQTFEVQTSSQLFP